jgi:hypothetical protein
MLLELVSSTYRGQHAQDLIESATTSRLVGHNGNIRTVDPTQLQDWILTAVEEFVDAMF